jgi:solute carrier family 25 (peroxisomal adenine nucleotide transporter), member 17
MDVLVHGISGSISGLTAIMVWYPLEILRMREQTELLKTEEILKDNSINNPSQNTTNQSSDNRISSTETYNVQNDNFINKLKKFLLRKLKSIRLASEIISKEGISCLYNGMSSAMIGQIITSGIYFLTYKFFKELLIKQNFTKGIVIDSMVTSFLASTCTAIGSNPIWVLNTRMSKSKKELGKIGNIAMINQIIKEEGVGGFFKGLIPSLFLTANPVIQFIIYEMLRIRLIDSKGNISVFNIVVISIISKLITTLVTYPMLTIKTLFQANETKKNQEIFQILVKLLSDEGFVGYYKGK